MVRKRFFAHVAPDGGTLKQQISRSRYLNRTRSYRIGENLSTGAPRQTSLQSATYVTHFGQRTLR